MARKKEPQPVPAPCQGLVEAGSGCFSPQLGPEGRMYLIRESIMPMLQLTQQETPIVWRSFKCPRGQELEGLGKKTLGSRIRGFSQSVARVKRFVEEEAKQPEVDPQTVGSHKLVLWTPPADDPERRKEVVVDFDVSCKLREHQRIGVQFLFDCLMGLKDFNGCGCILADDMGLGKTLQSVAAIWTLLTQGGPNGRGCCRKALVLCPASLVKNWAGELDKWLHGKCKYTACAVTGSAQVSGTFGAFKYDRESRVLIASYETFRNHAREVEDAGIDLIVCDEAHKLKNDEAATTRCISGLAAKRRLLISGTPIQNSLEEFFTLVSLANPGVFGELQEFRRRFANPILKGREPTATAAERQKAEEMLAEVSRVTDKFILRRTNRLNARFLPPKQIFNVFVMPTDFQRRLYRSFLKSNIARKLLEENCKMTRSVLGTIKKLQGLVNHPYLVRSSTQKLEAGFDDEETKAMFGEIDRMDQGLKGAKPVREELSGKLALVHQILSAIRASKSGDRIVLISNWTQTLDLIERMCGQYKWPTHRLDGSMAISKRMKLVTDFNRPENDQAFAFLLSSKAGGCGLNLIGANRLVMFDPDWNPANDRQAMARVWRDGQKKPCYIYRLFTTGTIDEKVYQRQICKDGLSNMMVTETGEDEAQMTESLASDEVKDLFTFSEKTACATHDMLSCQRCSTDAPSAVPQEEEVLEDDLRTWSHHPGAEGIQDDILQEASKQLSALRSWTRGHAARGVPLGGISFTMGCHIEYTKEQIAKLEAEERQEQEKRKAQAKPTPTPVRAEVKASRAQEQEPPAQATTAQKPQVKASRAGEQEPPAQAAPARAQASEVKASRAREQEPPGQAAPARAQASEVKASRAREQEPPAQVKASRAREQEPPAQAAPAQPRKSEMKAGCAREQEPPQAKASRTREPPQAAPARAQASEVPKQEARTSSDGPAAKRLRLDPGPVPVRRSARLLKQ
ncbi:unnamed protein product [Effrenium voratum]|uniref:DNA repair and recombination protein RAD54-like n=1 Tax=Effrenium voratum TaxID=2562239 RepID=A0AA36I3T6_9DINO|nr:unnamed protein product [Effrenium voratum]